MDNNEHGTNLAEVGTDVHDNNVGELISRQAALVAVKDALMAWSYMPEWRDEKILEAIAELPPAEPKKREMNIEQEKMIVEALPSLYPLKNFEEEAIHAVLDAIPHWIPVEQALPEEPFGCLVTVMDTNPVTMEEFENILPYFVGWDGEQWNDEDGQQCPFEVIAWMPLPEAFKAVTDGRD